MIAIVRAVVAVVSALAAATEDAAVELVVIEPDGTPASRVSLAVRAVGSQAGAAPSWRWAAATEGRVTIGGLDPARAVAIRLRTDSSAVAVTRALLPGGAATTVKLEAGRAVRGVVVDAASGAPIGGASVIALASADPCALVDPATTAEDGSFVLVGVPASAKTVRAAEPSRIPKAVPIQGDSLRIPMEARAGEAATLRFDAAPAPGETWRVVVERPGSRAESDVDPSGEFSIPALSAGRYDAVLLRSSESEGWTWRFWVTSLDLPVRAPRAIKLKGALAPGEVRARVVRAGSPEKGAGLRAYPVGVPESPTVVSRTAADGTARLPNLQGARTWIAVDGTLAGTFCDVPESGAARAEIEIPAGTVLITLSEEGTSAPIRGATVLLSHDDGKGTADVPPVPAVRATTDEHGIARFESVPPGTFIADTATDTDDGLLGAGRARIVVALGAAESRGELRAVRGGFVAGSAFRDGAPIDEPVRLFLRDGGTGRRHAVSSEFDGSFRIGPLAAGRHPLFAFGKKSLFTAGVVSVDAALGATRIADVDLFPGGTLDVRVEAEDPANLRRVRVVAEPKPLAGTPAWTEFLSPAERNDFLRAAALDARGQARVGPAPPGRYRVRAVAPDGATLAEDDGVIAAGGSAVVLLKIRN